jgi:hypothetical protein
MSRRLEPVLPPALRRMLAADVSLDDGFTILVLTDGRGWPHLAMISRGELICVGDALRLALWPTSNACANLTTRGRATLYAVTDGIGYSVRVATSRMPDLTTPRAGTLACFHVEIESVFGDEAPYAVLESGVRFRLLDREGTVARWREVHAALQAARTP